MFSSFQPQPNLKSSTIPCPPCDWITVPSYSIFHFAPEVPIYTRPCQLEVQLGLSYREGAVVAERTVVLNMDEIKTHHKLNVPPVVADELGAHQMVYLYTESDSSLTNVLKVSNFPSADSFAAELRKNGDSGHKMIIGRQREKRFKELAEMKSNLQSRLNMLNKRYQQESSRTATALKAQKSHVRPSAIPPRQSAVIIEVKAARGIPCRDSYILVQFNGITQRTAIVTGSNSPSYNHQFIFNTTTLRGSSAIRIVLIEDTNIFVKDKERGSLEFSLYDLDHESRTSWLPLRTKRGENVGELHCSLWHVPKAESKVEEELSEVEGLLSEKKRILAAVEAEIQSMQEKRWIDQAGKVMPVHLQNDVHFKVQLKSIDGLDEALASLHTVGDLVCRIRSELTGKTTSIFCVHYEPDHVTNIRSSTKIRWAQEVSIHIPEEMLSQRDEVLHLVFFFHPRDFAADGDASPVHANSGAIKNAGFLKATKLRANCPPIALAHVSIPLAGVPVQGTKEDAESRVGTKTQIERRLIDWQQNRLPLQVDLYSYEKEMSVTVCVVRLPAKSEENRSQFSVRVSLPMLSLSLVDSTPSEILFFSITNTNFSFDDTLCTNDLELKVDRIQLDNQTVGALFPVILGFSPVEPEEFQPLIQLSIARRKSRIPNVQIYEYASLLIQQMDVKVEEELIYTVIRYINSFRPDDNDLIDQLDDKTWFTKSISKEFAVNKEEETLLFMEFLQVQPIAVNVWFEAAPGMRARMSRSQVKYNPMDTVLSIVGTAMGSIKGAPIRLNGRTFEHVRGSVPVILGSLAHHYKSEAVGEAYKVVGSFEFLGNPVAMVNNLGTGVIDFFYLPSKGAVESPEKFGIGLAKGSLSLVKGVTSGIFNTVGSITGSVSKGLAIATVSTKINAELELPGPIF